MSLPSTDDVRRLRYRLKRQGMAELDAWLAPLETPLRAGDLQVAEALSDMLTFESPHLLAMMQGDLPLPPELRPWLQPSV